MMKIGIFQNIAVVATLAFSSPIVNGFTNFNKPLRIVSSSSSSTSFLNAEKDGGDDSKGGKATNSLFESDAWKNIKNDLDKVPVFTVATKEGNPLAYTIEIGGKGEFNVPCFYVDVDAALSELTGARDNASDSEMKEGLDIVPFPLGQAFQLWSNDQAVIVPSKQAIQQAGAPPGTNPIGQQVPMFACMEIAEEREDGTPRLPVFLRLEDANAALKEAVDADGGSEDDFEVACLSLSGVVSQLATVPDTPAFHFIPPSTSMTYIQEYLS